LALKEHHQIRVDIDLESIGGGHSVIDWLESSNV
jgi:hypothetical protein